MKKIEMKLSFTMSDEEYEKDNHIKELKNEIHSGKFQREFAKDSTGVVKNVKATIKIS